MNEGPWPGPQFACSMGRLPRIEVGAALVTWQSSASCEPPKRGLCLLCFQGKHVKKRFAFGQQK